MDIAYFIKKYPKVSHSFIRREIMALERLGYTVERFALCTNKDELVDPLDQSELTKIRHVLSEHPLKMGLAFIRTFCSSPLLFYKRFKAAIPTGLRSDRGLIRYLIETSLLLQLNLSNPPLRLVCVIPWPKFGQAFARYCKRIPCYQAFCGLTESVNKLPPCDSTERIHFRKRIAPEDIYKIFRMSVRLHGKAALKDTVNIDMATQGGNITNPTDAKLAKHQGVQQSISRHVAWNHSTLDRRTFSGSTN
jgi:hypothetical protein